MKEEIQKLKKLNYIFPHMIYNEKRIKGITDESQEVSTVACQSELRQRKVGKKTQETIGGKQLQKDKSLEVRYLRRKR